tara:strand:- start:362 stop:637 length:276 start_codon:yes stop_codon:yes gene_type:complete
MQVIPIGKKVLVKPVEKKTTTKGGIYLPESQQKQPPQGVIVARGDEVTKELQVGDTVRWLMAHTDEIEFMHDDAIHLVLSDTTIIAKIKDV